MVCFAEFQMLLFIRVKVQPEKGQKQKKEILLKTKKKIQDFESS